MAYISQHTGATIDTNIDIVPNLQTQINELNSKITAEQLINLIYPIGSIYMSVNEISPATFLGGTWEQIKDTFLLATGDTYAAGTSGGEAEHTLTVSEMPSHTHNSACDYGTKDTWTRHILQFYGYNRGSAYIADFSDYSGGSQPHNNMPPYLAVYMWKRID